MPSRTTIWFRDAFVIIFALYVVVSIAMVPWSNLKISEPASTTCPTGCSPSINFPENNYHHYDDSLTFDWKWIIFPFFHISVIIVSPGYTGEENRQSNLFSCFTSLSHILSIIERHAIPYVHIPCKIGFSNPAAFAKLGSECNGL